MRPWDAFSLPSSQLLLLTRTGLISHFSPTSIIKSGTKFHSGPSSLFIYIIQARISSPEREKVAAPLPDKKARVVSVDLGRAPARSLVHSSGTDVLDQSETRARRRGDDDA